MPYFVRRNAEGSIIQFSKTPDLGFEAIDTADPEVSIFTDSAEQVAKVERLIKALILKGVITRAEIKAQRAGR
jgi:hypothetical protein